MFRIITVVIYTILKLNFVNSWNIRNFFFPMNKINKQKQSNKLEELLITNDRAALDKLLFSTLTLIDKPAISRLTVANNVVGCWQVGAVNGLPSWQKYSKVLTILKPKNVQNRNFQFFSSNGSFSNVAEYFGPDFFAFTEGTFSIEPAKQVADSSSRLKLTAAVNRIVLSCFGNSFSVNVSGKGVVTVLYGDASKRVVESEQGAQALQIRVPFPREFEKYPALKIYSS